MQFFAVAAIVASGGALSFVGVRADAAANAPAPAAMSKAEADGIIFERQNLMLQLGKDAETLGDIAAGIQPKTKLADVTRSIAETTAASRAAFEPNVPGGRAKPEIWTNWADYARRLDELDKGAKQLAELGAKGDLATLTNVLADALPCKGCHDAYRGPKKPG
ncbi:MAG: cytochrome c [Sphingomonas sp.]